MTQDHEEYYRPDPHADEDLVPFDVQGYEGKKGIWLLGLLVIALMALLVFLFKVYQPGVRDRGDAPKILADSTPYKVEPESPGGDVAPNQDLEVYDVMNGTTKDGKVNISDAAEEPIKRPGNVEIEVRDRDAAETPVKAAPKPAPVVKTPTAPKSGDSRYVVQLASLRSQADADDAWAKIQKTHKSIMPNSSYADIKRASVPNKGIYYRVRLAGMADKATAKRVCDQLQARNQSCFVTTK